MRIITRDDIQRIGDAESLMQFLDEKLGLPIPEGLTLGDIVTKFSPYSLGLSRDIGDAMLDCQEISGARGKPSGIFLIRFRSEEDYSEVLRFVSDSPRLRRRNPADFGFICAGENYQPFAFAYFSDSAGGDWQNAELTVFSWIETKTVVHTGAKHELPDVFFPEPPSSESESEHAENFDETEADYEEEVVPPDDSDNRSGDNRVTPPTPDSLLAKLQEVGTLLRHHVNIYSGVHTGYRQAFVIEDASTSERMLSEHPRSADIIKPMVDVPSRKKWRAEPKHLIYIPSGRNRQWPWSGALHESEAEQIFADAYPAVHDYLNSYRDDLKARTQQGEFYWESPSSKRSDLLGHPKIIYPYSRGNSMRACYEESGAFVLTPSFFIPTEDLSLLAILNSRLFNWWARSECLAPRGNRLDFKKGTMEVFPVANRTEAQKARIAEYVQLILEDPDSHEVSAFEAEIDALVYNLYGLTDAEIALIEGN